ncbi:undecaprenyldiphospho-muramoylpentapeptide beta-N-acetylglucosaminyltransferase [Campylobacter sp. VBCF_06 NA8]|uniref:undecaprenyldiphospho-muramoylpentapeptide beta-N-acetylglucosaminyltransferase n=1 Tax=Campylobacter sp. VBCF_06 NA8 TaxID=2983822 RepID=UPI0022E9E07C|nr:undecaprenyldiphospho-muramoylpentapeptide beta-N-acetylglucosaminyltransferase [Campylobacter sp. VBCF_06 NA8]MDA3046384.1 undecaprenyldiphospho-muramoylpentapeptide beta-N-acetylglucosaminyltransferase [Campylobacter sp. VBCF_06 NA8]
MIAISGGGTGGHLSIAKSLGAELKNRGIGVIFIGSTNGQDRAWFEGSEIFERAYFLESSGVVNKKGLSKFASLINILKLSLKCRKIFKENGVKAVISVGGYSSAPASFASLFFFKPLFIHEQNAILGRLNDLLEPFCKKIYSPYSREKFELPTACGCVTKFTQDNTQCISDKFDYPVSDIFFEKARIRSEIKTIIFLGGSQGASFINTLASNLAPRLTKMGYEIIHQCGEKEFEKYSEFYKNANLNVELVGFSKNLVDLISKADLCVGRSGASTLWELVANGLPAIFVPFPHAAGDHQFYNAKFLQDLNLCKIVRQNEASEDKILDLIQNFDAPSASRGLVNFSSKNGAKSIIDDILSQI